MHEVFAPKDLGKLSYFLGIEVQKTLEGLHLSHKKYITNLLCRAKMQTCSMPKELELLWQVVRNFLVLVVWPNERCSIVQEHSWSTQYAKITKSEIDSIHQFMQSPLQSHWKIVKRMLRYFKLWFTSKERLNTESCWLLRCWLGIWSWWSQVYFRFLCFSWHSKKQHTISWSSTEAKYKSLAKSRVEISWIKALLEKLQILCTKTPTIWCDNLNTILLSTNPVQHARTKHIELDLYFLCEKIAQDQVVDILTKAISSTRFYELRINLKVKPLSNLSLLWLLCSSCQLVKFLVHRIV